MNSLGHINKEIKIGSLRLKSDHKKHGELQGLCDFCGVWGAGGGGGAVNLAQAVIGDEFPSCVLSVFEDVGRFSLD